jgi:hypothetical protein
VDNPARFICRIKLHRFMSNRSPRQNLNPSPINLPEADLHLPEGGITGIVMYEKTTLHGLF